MITVIVSVSSIDETTKTKRCVVVQSKRERAAENENGCEWSRGKD